MTERAEAEQIHEASYILETKPAFRIQLIAPPF